MELPDLTLTEAAAGMRAGQYTAVELVEHFLKKIEQRNQRLNAYLHVDSEVALRTAKRVDEDRSHRQKLPPLFGLPVGLKDLYETKDFPTEAGSKVWKDHIPGEDAVLVKKIKQSGGIVLGMHNMHEIALGVTNVNPHYGACHNPWDLTRMSGGSSGGSAVAVAAGLCLAALGTDTGGSIRIPASLCGVVGLKPTYGRCSLRGIIPLSWNLDHAGPLAKCVADAALLLQILAGYDPLDPASFKTGVPDYISNIDKGVNGLKIGLVMDDYIGQAAPDVLALYALAGSLFRQLGAQVGEIALPGFATAATANTLMVVSDAATVYARQLRERPEDFGADVLTRLKTGASYSAIDYAGVRRIQSETRRNWQKFFDRFDILLTPTTPVTAPPIQGPDAVEQAKVLTKFTSPFNLTGFPAISIPCGFTSQGLPAGLQLVAALWQEKKLFQAAFAYEQAAGWYKRTPPVND